MPQAVADEGGAPVSLGRWQLCQGVPGPGSRATPELQSPSCRSWNLQVLIQPQGLCTAVLSLPWLTPSGIWDQLLSEVSWHLQAGPGAPPLAVTHLSPSMTGSTVPAGSPTPSTDVTFDRYCFSARRGGSRL